MFFNPSELINIALEKIVEVENINDPMENSSIILNENFNGIKSKGLSSLPLYMALHLQKINRVKIIVPVFFDIHVLENLIEMENESEELIELPDEKFFELAKILNVKSQRIVQIAALRKSKLIKALSYLTGKAFFIKNLTMWEFNEIKEFIIRVMLLGNSLNA